MPSTSPLIMGVLNVTPDSFSDGGRYETTASALAHAEEMIREGAHIIDVGGESTRPGSEPVDSETEKKRVLPVIEKLKTKFPNIQISVDTYKVAVADVAVAAGADIINDITAAKDMEMAKLANQRGVTLLLMHMQGTPRTMQEAPAYPNGVLTDVSNYLKTRVRLCMELGIPKEDLWIDPGIGFGKTVQQNLDLLRRLDKLEGIGGRLVIGTSRKSFISKLNGDKDLPMEERLPGSIASQLYAYTHGASVFRVHDVKEIKRAMQMWDSISFGI